MRKFRLTLAIIAIVLLILIRGSGYIIRGTDYKNTVLISLTGDILLDRGVRDEIISNGEGYPYKKVKNILKKSDILIGNLECPLTLEGVPVLKNRNLIFRADPGNISALSNCGFNLLNLANNHTMDYGPEGLIDTITLLEEAGVRPVGAGYNREKAHEAVFIEKFGILFGFLSFSAFPPEGYFYSEDKPGVAHIDRNTITDEINEARQKCDFLIISFHWGREFDFYASEDQIKLAYMAIDNGADIVAGHHPHVLQGVEKYKDGYIFYSLGNFVFDSQIPSGTDETVIVNLKVSDKGINEVEFIPVRIKNCQPIPVKGEDAKHILNRLLMYSESMNTGIYIKNDRGYLNYY